MLRIGLLADTVEYAGGIGRYVREVLAALGARSDVRLNVLAPRSAVATVERLGGDVLDAVTVPPRDDQISLALWSRYRSGSAFEAWNADVVIGTKHLLPRTATPTVLVVHDMLTITRARENALPKRLLLPRQYRNSLTDATALVAVSAATRTRLAEIGPAWNAKCSVIPNGMSPHLLDATPTAPAALTPEAGPFALVVGDLSPRKNLGLLTRLWSEAPPADLRLVVVGPDSGGDHRARTQLLELERAGRAIWIRDADDSVLRWCYEQARIVLFPTFEEGFGLPLLEALAFHAPVLASTDRALREVADGDPSVIHLDPTDGSGWRNAIAAVPTGGRATRTPSLPTGAITWAEHTDRLIALARSIA